MYKLIATTALVAVTATSASAWTDAKTLITELEKVYAGVDGTGVGSHFENISKGTGELGTFVTDVDAGVTHITLTVGTDNQITAGINEGKTLAEIQSSADNLVNRINYDLFHDATPEDANDDTISQLYDPATDYTITATQTDSLLTYGNDLGNIGLVGNKVNDITTAVTTINTGLVNAPGTTQAEIDAAAAANTAFITAYNDGLNEEHFGVNVGDFLGDITEVNGSITAAGGSNFFGNTSNFAVTSGTQSAFAVPGLQTDGTLDLGGGETYANLLDWAKNSPDPAP